MRAAVITSASFSVLAVLTGLAMAAPVPEKGPPLDRQVRSLLAERCVSCHGPAAQLSGLRLDSPEEILKGGKRGPAYVPGAPAQSLLIQAVRYNGAVKMPPAGKLKDSEIALLSAWVSAAGQG